MVQPALFRAGLLCALWQLAPAGKYTADERDVAAEFKAAKANLTAQLRGKRANRLEAVQKLESYPTLDAAKLLFTQGLSSDDIDVRRATFDVLAKFSEDKEVSDYLKSSVVGKWKGTKVQSETLAGVGLLLASGQADVQTEAVEMAQEAAKRPNRGRISLITLTDELSVFRGEAACRALLPLIDLDLFDDDFSFRRAVVQALTQVRAKTAVPALIRILGGARGEVRADIVKYLNQISGQQFADDVRGWTQWWEKNEEGFNFPTQPPAGAPMVTASQPVIDSLPGGPSYYGLPLYGAKIVFVIDVSGSMRGERIVAAKRELVRAIQQLPNDVLFNIVAFNNRNYIWQKRLVPASDEKKNNAIYFIAALTPGSTTASYDALDAALQFDAESVYFLSDGAPVGGRITSPPDIVRAIYRDNQFRRMTINSLGIGVGAPGNAFDSFLSVLAQQNYGVYQRVDE